MKIIKYLVIGAVAICMLVVAALVVLPSLVSVDKYKPEIERFASERLGVPITLGGDVDLSFFPWTGLAFENLIIGNPQGFSSDTFVKVKRFRTGVKLMSLIRGNVEIDSFVVDEPEIFVERTPKGRWNWQRPEKTAMKTGEKTSIPPNKSKPETVKTEEKKGGSSGGGLPIKSFNVGEFSITGGRILVDDKQAGFRRELSDFNLILSGISLDNPVGVESSWLLEGQRFALNGKVGPLGSNPGHDPISFELQLSGMEILAAIVRGKVDSLLASPTYELNLSVAPFNPREAAEKMGMAFPVKTNDPSAITRFGMDLSAEGSNNSLAVSKMVATLDDTTATVQVGVSDFAGPDLDINLEVDRINLDRYLPPPESAPAPAVDIPEKADVSTENSRTREKEQKVSGKKTVKSTRNTERIKTIRRPEKKIDYSPLRKLVLDLKAEMKEITVHGGSIDGISLDVAGEKGLFMINRMAVQLYEGSSETTGQLSFQGEQPTAHLVNMTGNVLAGPLITDFTGKEFLEGTTFIDAEIRFSGQEPAAIKRSLHGKGSLRFEDGAIVGIDLAQMARQIKSGFTLAEQGEKPKTDFAELVVPFVINNGIFHTEKAALQSPFIRVAAHGNADLMRETLDLRVRPKIVGTMKGQGDTEERSGVAVPVIVSGSFSKPEFTLDLKALVKEEIPDEERLQELLDKGDVSEDTQKAVKEGAELLKNLFGN